MIGLIYKDYDQTQPAIDAYEEALRRHLPAAARAEVVQELAELLLRKQGNHAAALAALDQCPPEYVDRPAILTLRAECLWRTLRKEPEARRLVEQALRADPDHVPALRLLGMMHLMVEQPEPAAPLLQKAVRLDPHDHRSRNQLAEAYRQLGDQLLAAEAAETAARALSPFPGVSVATLGREHFYRQADEERRRRDATHDYMHELTALNEEAMTKLWDDDVRYRIAVLWLKMGRPELARTWLNAALACNPDNENAQKLLRGLAAAPR
jgi:tetratricopeptide (TPR) repeat protein